VADHHGTEGAPCRLSLCQSPRSVTQASWVNQPVVCTRGLKANTWVDFVFRYCVGVQNRISDFIVTFSDVMVLVQVYAVLHPSFTLPEKINVCSNRKPEVDAVCVGED
jgi:hypothetical protein